LGFLLIYISDSVKWFHDSLRVLDFSNSYASFINKDEISHIKHFNIATTNTNLGSIRKNNQAIKVSVPVPHSEIQEDLQLYF
jgi:hypothetical protein